MYYAIIQAQGDLELDLKTFLATGNFLTNQIH